MKRYFQTTYFRYKSENTFKFVGNAVIVQPLQHFSSQYLTN